MLGTLGSADTASILTALATRAAAVHRAVAAIFSLIAGAVPAAFHGDTASILTALATRAAAVRRAAAAVFPLIADVVPTADRRNATGVFADLSPTTATVRHAIIAILSLITAVISTARRRIYAASRLIAELQSLTDPARSITAVRAAAPSLTVGLTEFNTDTGLGLTLLALKAIAVRRAGSTMLTIRFYTGAIPTAHPTICAAVEAAFSCSTDSITARRLEVNTAEVDCTDLTLRALPTQAPASISTAEAPRAIRFTDLGIDGYPSVFA